jgi:hypothetical protein
VEKLDLYQILHQVFPKNIHEFQELSWKDNKPMIRFLESANDEEMLAVVKAWVEALLQEIWFCLYNAPTCQKLQIHVSRVTRAKLWVTLFEKVSLHSSLLANT